MYDSLIYHPNLYTVEDLMNECLKLGIITTVKITPDNIGYITIGNYTKYAVYCYGNASSIIDMLRLGCEYSRTNKITIILFDYPGYGISKGSPSEKNNIDALNSVLKNFNSVQLIGESLGTGVVLSYVGKFGSDKILSIRLVSPFTSLLRVISSNMIVEMFYDVTGSCHYRNYNNIAMVPHKIPVYIYSLIQDELIPPIHGKILHESGNNVRFFEISDAKFNHSSFGYKCVRYPL